MSERIRPKNRRYGIRTSFGSGPTKVHLSTGEYEDGTLCEVFLDANKEGTFARDILRAFAIAVSIGLQHGVPLSTFQSTYEDFKMEPDILRSIFAELRAIYQK